MKKNRILTVLLGCVMILGLCQCKKESNQEIIEINLTDALRNQGSFILGDIVKDVEIITLDTVPDAYFINAGGLTLTENYICFACNSQNRVYLFDRAGKFIRNIGRSGKGPGEFISPNNVAVSPNEQYVVVGDMRTNKLILYDINGYFIREKKLEDDTPGYGYDDLVFNDDGNVIVSVKRPPIIKEPFSSILIYNIKLEVVQEILHKPIDKKEGYGYLNYYSLGATNDGYCFWETMTDTVYYFKSNGESHAGYHIDLKNKTGYSDILGKMTQVMSVLDLPDYLVISVMINGEGRTFLYNKKTDKTNYIDHPIECLIESNSWITKSIINNAYGIEPVWLGKYNSDNNELVTLVRPGWVGESSDLDCLRKRDVLLPEIRDQLLNISENNIDKNNSAILIMKLRSKSQN